MKWKPAHRPRGSFKISWSGGKAKRKRVVERGAPTPQVAGYGEEAMPTPSNVLLFSVKIMYFCAL